MKLRLTLLTAATLTAFTFAAHAAEKQTFVLVHGGWPYEKEAGVMLMKPNVYADFSAQVLLRSPRAIAQALHPDPATGRIDPAHPGPGTLIDVLPPFAGG